MKKNIQEWDSYDDIVYALDDYGCITISHVKGPMFSRAFSYFLRESMSVLLDRLRV